MPAPDARLPERMVPLDDADVLLAGVPYDASVLGRKGAKDGPTAIREAFQFIAAHDPHGPGLDCTVHDAGDLALPDGDVLATHDAVREQVRPLLQDGRPVVLLGGDHGLTFPHVQALSDAFPGDRIGIVVIDAHYDLRPWEGQPTSGTPFRRILEELDGAVRPENLVEIGIRPFANAPSLAAYAAGKGVHIMTAAHVRTNGIHRVAEEALRLAGDGVDHVWLSVDIDGLDQSIAAGCSAPGAGGLHFPQAQAIVEAVAADPRCRGMDLMEVAPALDPTGNTQRTAAQLVAHFMAAVTARP